MTRRIKHIKSKPADAIRIKTSNGFDEDIISDNGDSTLFKNISEFMKGHLDIEDVKSDPSFSGIKEDVKKMMLDYNQNISRNKDNEKFIRETLSGEVTDKDLDEEISNIKKEIGDNNLNKITSEWVNEWHKKKQSIGTPDPNTEERKNFVERSIKSEVHKPVKMNPFNFRYASLLAAALIGAFILIRTLLPSGNPDVIFDSYYKPFDAISPVTRSMNNNETDIYSLAIGSYKTGDYHRAAREFSEIILKDPTVVSPRFFMGLTQLALKNYDQTINLLSGVIDDSGEYSKEAKWYLGLTYLKSGNKPKAVECFEYLAKSTGFYSERSEAILRRLK